MGMLGLLVPGVGMGGGAPTVDTAPTGPILRVSVTDDTVGRIPSTDSVVRRLAESSDVVRRV